MSEEFGPDFVTITDEETGEDYELEHVGTIEYQGETYMAFLPAEMDEDDEDFGYIILKVVEVNGEEMFSSLDSDDELEAVYNLFMEQLFAEDDEEE